MNPKLIEYIKSQTPQLNPVTANGIVVEHMKEALNYVNSVIEAIAVAFPEGFTYDGCSYATPMEEYGEITRPRDSKRTYDLARNDRYMVRFNFSYAGKTYSKLISLPFVGEAGIITVRGTRYVVSPVLSDKIISVDQNGKIFLRLLRSKLNFDRMPRYYFANGIRETIQVVKSSIYNHSIKGKTSKPVIKAETILVFYLLCKFGLADMFKTYTGVEPIVIDENQYESPDDIYKDYPKNKWVVCRSMGVKPDTFKARMDYFPTNVALAIPINQYKSNAVKSLIAGFFYVADHFPHYINTTNVDDVNVWRVALGQVLWSSDISHGRLLHDINEHINGLDQYIDNVMVRKFASIGMPVKDIWELFYIIIERYNDWLFNSINNVSSLYDKEITILNFFFFDITTMFVKFFFKIIKASASTDGLTDSKIRNAINSTLFTDDIITKLVSKHGELSVVDSASDNRIFKVTQVIVPQDKTNKGMKTNDKPSLDDRRRFVDVSTAEVCTYTSMTKAEPTGWTRLNMHLEIAPNGSIIRHEDLRPMLDAIQAELRRR